MAKRRRRKRRSGLAADVMKCAQYRTKKGVLRCLRMLRGPGRPVKTRRKRPYHYTTAAGRKARRKRKR